MPVLPKLYGSERSRADRCLWALYEMGIPFEHISFDHRSPPARPPELLRLNPSGKVPVLVDDDLVLTESLAINLYLAQTYMTALWPGAAPDRAKVLQWTLWAANEVEPRAVALLHNRVTRPPDQRIEAVAVEAEATLKPRLALLDRHLARAGEYLVGTDFSIADINVAAPLSFLRICRFDLSPYPTLHSWLQGLEARHAYRRVHRR